MHLLDTYDEAERDPHVECPTCGKGGLHWVDEDGDGAWVLHDSLYGVHHCDPARIKKMKKEV